MLVLSSALAFRFRISKTRKSPSRCSTMTAASIPTAASQDRYQAQAFRALNQGLGRCIRHQGDWGALLLIDCRFAKQSCVQGLSKWVRKRIKHHQRFQDVLGQLESFIKRRQEPDRAPDPAHDALSAMDTRDDAIQPATEASALPRAGSPSAPASPPASVSPPAHAPPPPVSFPSPGGFVLSSQESVLEEGGPEQAARFGERASAALWVGDLDADDAADVWAADSAADDRADVDEWFETREEATSDDTTTAMDNGAVIAPTPAPGVQKQHAEPHAAALPGHRLCCTSCGAVVYSSSTEPRLLARSAGLVAELFPTVALSGSVFVIGSGQEALASCSVTEATTGLSNAFYSHRDRACFRLLQCPGCAAGSLSPAAPVAAQATVGVTVLLCAPDSGLVLGETWLWPWALAPPTT
eukprot:m.188906 g.188906  ORF g.188906 m.188906 type:complete len:412 (-) comp18197_c0_seq2:49-1284(-)